MLQDIKKKLHRFFPGQAFIDEDIKAGLEREDLLVERDQILPFLQTALFDEKVLEVELDSMPRVYFSRLMDDPSDFIEDGDEPHEENGYNQGDYLTKKAYITTLPLEPGLGNLHLRYSRHIVLRMFINTFAVELAATFQSLATVGDLPVLKLSYPVLARKVYDAREFRAKVPDQMDFSVSISLDEELPELNTRPVNISIKGMAFSIDKKEQKMFAEGESHPMKLYVDDELMAMITGRIRHHAKIRKRSGIEYLCGVEFDLETRTLASVIESLVASVQRAHLKDLAEKSDASGIDLIGS